MALLKQNDSMGKAARETLIKSTRKSNVSDSQIPNTCPGVRMGDRCDSSVTRRTSVVPMVCCGLVSSYII